MKIQFKTKLQKEIATKCWHADGPEEIKKIFLAYGTEALIVFNMIVAHYLDTINDVSLANNVLTKYRIKND